MIEAIFVDLRQAMAWFSAGNNSIEIRFQAVKATFVKLQSGD